MMSEELFAWSDVGSTVILYNVMINCLARGGRWQEALALLRKMGRQRFQRDLFGFCGVLRACGACGAWVAGLATFSWAQRSTRALNEVLSSSVLSTCSSQWPIVLLLLASMMRLRVANEQSFCAAMSGSWRNALQIFNLMPKALVERDLPCRNASVLACRRARRWSHALMIVEKCKGVKRA